MQLKTRLHGATTIKAVKFTRAAYVPDGVPMVIPAQRITAEVHLQPGEAVDDVLTYHYKTKYSDVEIL